MKRKLTKWERLWADVLDLRANTAGSVADPRLTAELKEECGVLPPSHSLLNSYGGHGSHGGDCGTGSLNSLVNRWVDPTVVLAGSLTPWLVLCVNTRTETMPAQVQAYFRERASKNPGRVIAFINYGDPNICMMTADQSVMVLDTRFQATELGPDWFLLQHEPESEAQKKVPLKRTLALINRARLEKTGT